MQNDLIFDIGMHQGRDTRFYLDKGFRVIAVEAAPELARAGNVRFAKDIADNRLVIVERAIAKQAGQTINFYINPDKDDWGSSFRGGAEKGRGTAVEISVETTTLKNIYDDYGIPYYIKCDIEGSDDILVEQALAFDEKPVFLSVEIARPTDLDNVAKLGYRYAQLVNQALNVTTRPPNPSREGLFVDARFNGHCSGLFGRDLDPKRWVSVGEARDRFQRWLHLKKDDPTLATGWLDIHLTNVPPAS